MSVNTQKETLGFQTEVNQLLHIVINSLYSNKEIFLRELISNASDAADKLRFEGISDNALYENDPELKVQVDIDKTARTITISDNGIGMNRQEIIENLGTIAKSGTKEFLSKLSGDQAKDATLIGQFGVGFYSAFIVADKITVESRRAGMTSDQGVRWESAGTGEYTIENTERKERGTQITLHIKSDEDEFLESWRLRGIINKYSDHIPIPIVMKKMGEEGKEIEEYETVNRATALWTLPKSEIKEEEYKELYKHVAHDFEEPLLWSHNRVEGKQQYVTLLYIPSHAPFDLWNREHPRGLKLYVQRTFIMDNAEQFLPLYLRFVRGVIDSSDLPLNISREILQHSKLTESMRSGVAKRVLAMLEDLSRDDKEKYQKFWQQFGQVLKEGPAEDFANKEKIAQLLRFASTHADNETQNVSLEEYIARMKTGQDKIYYITADSYNMAKNSPHLEIFRQKGIEVLLLTDRIDEWLIAHLTEFAGKQLQSIAKGDLDLGSVENPEEKEEQQKMATDFEAVAKKIKETLGEKIKEARITHRLTDSPACIVYDENDIGGHMQKLLKAAGHEFPTAKPILELNPKHPIVSSMKSENNDERFNEISHILLEQAILAEGGQLEDPAQFIRRMNKLLLQLTMR